MQPDQSKKIAILGGSFNPPHRGHAGMGLAALKHTECDELWIMPSSDRADKKISVSGADRLAMAKLMAEDITDRLADGKIKIKTKPVLVLDTELVRNKLTTTYETMTEFKEKYPSYEFWLIVGADVIPDIHAKWVNGEKLFNEQKFICIVRPGLPKPALEILPPQSVLFPNECTEDISSTATRARAHARDAGGLQKLVGERVSHYISEHNLYS